MIKKQGGLFWGVVVAAIGAAIAGGVVLLRSFRTTKVGGAARKALPKTRTKPAVAGRKTGGKKKVRRAAVRK